MVREFDAQSLSSTGTSISAQQLEQLLKLLPAGGKNSGMGSEMEDEFDHGFACMVTCCDATSFENEWMIDSGASDHMTGDLSMLEDPKKIKCGNKINLPNGLTSEISHYGDVTLKNNMTLKIVLHVGDFKHNLLSVTKLVKDNMCKVSFFEGFCILLAL